MKASRIVLGISVLALILSGCGSSGVTLSTAATATDPPTSAQSANIAADIAALELNTCLQVASADGVYKAVRDVAIAGGTNSQVLKDYEGLRPGLTQTVRQMTIAGDSAPEVAWGKSFVTLLDAVETDIVNGNASGDFSGVTADGLSWSKQMDLYATFCPNSPKPTS